MAIAAGGGAGAVLAFHGHDRSAARGASRFVGGHGFAIELPKGPLGWDARGLAILDAPTNLPAGTIVQLYYFSADEENPAMARVVNGLIPIRVSNTLCHQTEVGLIGTDVRVQATVLPSYPSDQGGFGNPRIGPTNYSPPPPLEQPPKVQAVLGSHFERLVGDQVRVQDGQRTLVVATTYELAATRCSAKLQYLEGGTFEVPVAAQLSVPEGPFSRPPFQWCPDAAHALPVESSLQPPSDVAVRFDVALAGHHTTITRSLADPSVQSLTAYWKPTGLADPGAIENVPSGEYLPAVPSSCGALVALRTWGVQVAADHPDRSVTYLLILRPDGWKVWGWLPGSGR